MTTPFPANAGEWIRIESGFIRNVIDALHQPPGYNVAVQCPEQNPHVANIVNYARPSTSEQQATVQRWVDQPVHDEQAEHGNHRQRWEA